MSLSTREVYAAAAHLAELAGLDWAVFEATGQRLVGGDPGEAGGCHVAGACPLTDTNALCPGAATAPVAEGRSPGWYVVACYGSPTAAAPLGPVRHLAGALGASCRLEQEMDRTVRELATTYQELAIAYGTLEAVSSPGSRDTVARAVLDRVLLAVGAEGGCFLTAAGPTDAAPAAVSQLPEEELAPLRSMAAIGLEAGGAQDLPFSFDMGQRHFLACPVEGNGRRLGLIAVCRSTRRPFTSREAKLLKATSRQAGLAILNRDLVDDLRNLFLSTVQALAAAVEAKDAYTSGHSRRVAEMARQTVRIMGLPPEQAQQVHIAAIVHDVGKIGVDTSILRKGGALTEAEWQELREHPVRGADIIGWVPQLQHLVGDVRHHHERLDGTGYPDGLVGEQIPLGARIIAVCDAYDAMTSERPYRLAKTPDYACAELLRGRRTQFDPEITEAFLQYQAGQAQAA